MGIWASKVFRGLFGGGENCKIVIVGLNNAGKTTILYKLHLGQVVLTQPTIGSNVEEVKHDNITFQVWDLGGQENLRAGWATYFQETDAVVFVVDSNDQENMVLAKMELFNVVLQEDLKHACLLVLANKQDIVGCRNAGEIAQDLSLHTIRTHEWQIQSCCALTGEGLQEGLEWIATRIRSRQASAASSAPVAAAAAAVAVGKSSEGASSSSAGR
mmetsp:Transcript_82537/g.209911  ORF Transcript_82537/g.209911 Transcript_82537/m.209911 type:complete len:215 (-) Transcript_82537:228-872(-)|eukprot:CAMPEP_0183435906 /NCGR_PEP_ID=MMETSP0370-20130417/68914_1 /TAXON_ID=268820 /ORGANISM="Peridinium aciculiferum, Strain PAER-2" /LENGTH=214 /DNA_ID=CAMNT_0025623177 /DNA_START=172 /DNA_END=816 /DNA_ORIENTATION=+